MKETIILAWLEFEKAKNWKPHGFLRPYNRSVQAYKLTLLVLQVILQVGLDGAGVVN